MGGGDNIPVAIILTFIHFVSDSPGNRFDGAVFRSHLHEESAGGQRDDVPGTQSGESVPAEGGQTADRPGPRDCPTHTTVHVFTQT